jgi:predicted nucleic acid-binding protein
VIYFDTSVLVPLLIPEATSTAIQTLFDELPRDEPLIFSQWGVLEFTSVVSRLSRMGELDEASRHACLDEFSSVLQESFLVETPRSEDYVRASESIRRFDNSLRAGDALHLAVAFRLSASTIYTLDKGMAKAGRLLNLPVQVPL